jgi:two-component system cell cycle sensor histidine kinase/response regulator CckA
MVYGIVKQANGYIWLYTEQGHGTSFKIMLPRYEGAEASRTPVPGSDARDGAVQAHVLLVEDQPNVRAAIARSLRNAGVSVTDVRDAEAALRVLEGTARIDVVITDMVMPGMSGAELAATLEVVRPTLPVIMMSGYSEELASRQWALPANTRFVEKPVNAKRLVQLMNDLLAAAPASLS